jgi:hypothetical protein
MAEQKNKIQRLQIRASLKGTLKKGKFAFPNPSTFSPFPDSVVLQAADGTQLYKFDTMRFTISETEGTTQYTSNWNGTSLGWGALSTHGDGPPDIFFEIQDAQGGDLDHWDVGKPDQPCETTHPEVFTNQNGKPGILETDTAEIGIVLTIGAGRCVFFKC